MSDYRPRLSVDLELEQHRKLQKYFPHGTQKIVFRLVVDDLIAMIEKYGAGPVLGCFIDREITLEEVLRGNDPRFERLDSENVVSRRSGSDQESSSESED